MGDLLSSPAINNDGVIYFGSGSRVFAVNNATGALIWNRTLGGPVFTSPALGSLDALYVGSYDGYVHALSLATGQPQWAYYTGGQPGPATPTIGGDGVVYAGSTGAAASTGSSRSTGRLGRRCGGSGLRATATSSWGRRR